jgi:uncharacterized protein (TIGR02284 family)
MENDDIIDTLNNLIETCKDGEYGFRSCAEHVRKEELRRFFDDRSRECADAAAELQRMVVQTGGKAADAEDSGSASGAVHRGWVALKGKLSGYSERAILEECERGEDTALERYREALEEPLPALLRSQIEKQYEGVKRNHARVRQLRDQARAASDA